MPKKENNADLSLNDFLIAEYGFISNTINRSTDSDIPKSVINFDITAFIGVIIAILSEKLNFDVESYSLVNILFIIFFIWFWFRGITTVIQIAHMRGAWYESMLALNHIKDFYMAHFPESAKAITWRTVTMPPKYKIRSASFILMLQVSLLSSSAFGASSILLLLLIGVNSAFWLYFTSFILGISSFFAHLVLYKRTLISRP